MMCTEMITLYLTFITATYFIILFGAVIIRLWSWRKFRRERKAIQAMAANNIKPQ